MCTRSRGEQIRPSHGCEPRAVLQALRQLGLVYVDLSRVGGGCPDILFLDRQGHFQLIEVKNPNKPPSARKLNAAQQLFRDDVIAAGGTIYVMTSIDELFELVGARRAA